MIIIVIAAVAAYFGSKAYARKLYVTTGYYALGALNLVLAAAPAGVGALLLFDDAKPSMLELLSVIAVATIPTAILVIRNLKLKNPVHIVCMTIVQIASVAIAVLGFFLMLILKFTGINTSGWGGVNPALEQERMQRERQAQYELEQYQNGLNMGRESTPYDSIPGGLSKDAQKGYQDGQR